MNLAKYTEIFKALSSEQRLKLYLMIAKNCCGQDGSYERAFTKACDCMGLSRSTVSHHLKVLQNAGLIICERTGQSCRCRINPKAFAIIREITG